MSRTHGKRATYVTGECRCESCTEAHAAYQLAANRRRAERLADGEAPARIHGTVGGYKNWACRCAECTSAAADAWRAWDGRRQAANA